MCSHRSGVGGGNESRAPSGVVGGGNSGIEVGHLQVGQSGGYYPDIFPMGENSHGVFMVDSSSFL